MFSEIKLDLKIAKAKEDKVGHLRILILNSEYIFSLNFWITLYKISASCSQYFIVAFFKLHSFSSYSFSNSFL